MKIKLLITGGTIDKVYNELTKIKRDATLLFSA